VESGQFGALNVLLVLQRGKVAFALAVFLRSIQFIAGQVVFEVLTVSLVKFFDGLLDGFADSEVSREEIDPDEVVVLVTEPD
jgi:hypothetical protein